MSGSLWNVGDDVDIYCPRCRLNLDGVVSAMVGEEIRQVQCRTCKSFVPYKQAVSDEERKEKTLKRVLNRRLKADRFQVAARPAAPAARSPERERWDRLTDGISSTQARVFRRDATYKEGDFVLHADYGLGHVEQIAPDGRLLVLFRDGFQWLELGGRQ